jgi:hypothetical protein
VPVGTKASRRTTPTQARGHQAAGNQNPQNARTGDPPATELCDSGFFYRLKPARGVTDIEADAFETRLQDYLKRQHLQCDGGPLRAWICRAEGETSPEDCLNLLAWFAGESSVVLLATNGIQVRIEMDRPSEFRIVLNPVDPNFAAVLTLYRSHRLSATQALKVLDRSAPFSGTDGTP